MCFRAGSAADTLTSARQRVYLINSRDDSFDLGKEGFLAILRSMSIGECGFTTQWGDWHEGSDILLCNRCPLKHEARESGRGEMLYETAGLEHHWREPAGGYN